MNVGGLLLLFVVAVGAVFGLYFIGAQTTANPVVDTYGNTTTAATNNTMGQVQNVTSTGLSLGGAAILFIAFIIGMVVIVALVAVATRKF